MLIPNFDFNSFAFGLLMFPVFFYILVELMVLWVWSNSKRKGLYALILGALTAIFLGVLIGGSL